MKKKYLSEKELSEWFPTTAKMFPQALNKLRPPSRRLLSGTKITFRFHDHEAVFPMNREDMTGIDNKDLINLMRKGVSVMAIRNVPTRGAVRPVDPKVLVVKLMKWHRKYIAPLRLGWECGKAFLDIAGLAFPPKPAGKKRKTR